MTDNEIIKALECCTTSDCINCPYCGDDLYRLCCENLMADTLGIVECDLNKIKTLKEN